MLSGGSVAGVGDDQGVAAARGVLPISDPDLAAAVAGLESAWAAVAALGSEVWSDADRRAVLVRAETVSRAMYGTSHTWLHELIEGDGLSVLPERSNAARLGCLLRIDSKVAGERIAMAAKLAPRRAMTGEILEPLYPATAAAHASGEIDAAHVAVIDDFFTGLPAGVDHQSRVESEVLLTDLAKKVSPKQVQVAATRLTALLDPDGTLTEDKDLAAQCYLRLGRQDANGLSKGSFVIDAETRAYLEPILATLAQPGNCNPDEPTPLVDDLDSDSGSDSGSGAGGRGDGGSGDGAGSSGDGGGGGDGGSDSGGSDSGRDARQPEPTLFDHTSSEDEQDPEDEQNQDTRKSRAGRDLRTQGQRNHDALKAVLRQMLASGTLGQHRGLPVTAIITMTAAELHTASGHAVTGTGSLVSMRDAIRMASHAHHYLAVFDDNGRALYLGRGKRLATADQRIVLIARDRGCTFPACTRPATWCQTHHITDWAAGGTTDIDSLTLACDTHHPLVGDNPNQWATTSTGPEHPQPGRTRWHPPEPVDPTRHGIVNHYHHPGEYLYQQPDPDDPEQ